MTGDLGDLAMPIPARSLTLRYFLHFPPDPIVLSLANCSRFDEATGKFSFRSFGQINLKRNPSDWNRYIPIVSMIFLEERGTRGRSNGRNDPRNMVEKIIRSALIICRMNRADCEKRVRGLPREPVFIVSYERSIGRRKETGFFGRMA